MYPYEKVQPYKAAPGPDLASIDHRRDDSRRAWSARPRVVTLFFTAIALSLFLKVFHHCNHASPAVPLTVDQRVKNILSNTPLIGK